MPSRDAPPNIHALLQAIQQEHGTNDIFEALAIYNSLNGNHAETKWFKGHRLLRDDPGKWFRGTQIDERDLALINASPLPWVDIGKQSYLKHVVHEYGLSQSHRDDDLSVDSLPSLSIHRIVLPKDQIPRLPRLLSTCVSEIVAVPQTLP